MRAMITHGFGGPEVLGLGEVANPTMDAAGLSVRIRVHATAVNRADLLQRLGKYPPPPGASEVLGLECAGEVLEVGPHVSRFVLGQRVMALLPGGGYAEQAVVDEGSVIAVPDAFSDAQAAAFCETFLTAYLTIFRLGVPRPRRGYLFMVAAAGLAPPP